MDDLEHPPVIQAVVASVFAYPQPRPGVYVTRGGGVAVVEYITHFEPKHLFCVKGYVRRTVSQRSFWVPVGWNLRGQLNPGYFTLARNADERDDHLCERWDPEYPVPASYKVPDEYLREYGLTLDRNA